MSWVHLVFLALLVPSFFLYPSADEGVLVIFGNIAKIFSLLVAGISLITTQNAYAPGDTPQKAWTSLAAGMWIWFFAQSILAHYKLVLNESPYPSVADLFFVIAYLPLLVGLILLIKDFKSTGLPMGSRTSYIVHGCILLVVYAVVYFVTLHELMQKPDPAAMKFLNVGYPTLDFLLISMASVLVRITWMLRGGSIARSWILLCIGFSLVGVADIVFAYAQRPFLDVLFFSAYFLVALAGVYQIRVLRQ